jgi:hypothetical protein
MSRSLRVSSSKKRLATDRGLQLPLKEDAAAHRDTVGVTQRSGISESYVALESRNHKPKGYFQTAGHGLGVRGPVITADLELLEYPQRSCRGLAGRTILPWVGHTASCSDFAVGEAVRRDIRLATTNRQGTLATRVRDGTDCTGLGFPGGVGKIGTTHVGGGFFPQPRRCIRTKLACGYVLRNWFAGLERILCPCLALSFV